MADDSQTTGTVKVSDEARVQWPDVIRLILTSESMNDEERQYWINILPVMTPDQIENLKQILTNERSQLDAIDAKYEQEMKKTGVTRSLDEIQKERQQKQFERSAKEDGHEDEEHEKEMAILKAIAEMSA